MDGFRREYKTRRGRLYFRPSRGEITAMIRSLLRSALVLLPVLPAAAAPSAAVERGRVIAVITEYTDFGRKVAPPSADQPAYFVAQSTGQHDFGQALAGEPTLAAPAVQPQLAAALAAAHYLAAPAGREPTLLVIFSWGLHAQVAPDLEDPGYGNLLDRAALVAGQKFAAELRSVLDQYDLSVAATSQRPWGAQMPGMRPTTPAILQDGFSPLESFRRRDLLTARLLEQISDDCYYVIVTAYDYAALARGARRPLWRTKLSMRAQGTALPDAVAALLRQGSGYFGRDMDKPVLLGGG